MATVNDLLAVARGQLGVCENPPDSNNVRYNTWYWGREVSGIAYPWCIAFVQWCFAQVGTSLPARTASCGTLMNAAKQFGTWVTDGFQPGDVVIYDFTGKRTKTEHCGIVETVLPDYGVQAIEGNTSESGSQSNGGQVCRKNRPEKYIVGAVRPQFDLEEKEETMTGKEILAALTDEQAYELLAKAQRHAAALPAPNWAKGELAEAVERSVTDGKEPMALVTRCQAAIMSKRAGEQ